MYPTSNFKASYVWNAYVAPFAISLTNNILYESSNLVIVSKQTYKPRIKLTLDELKLVKDVKCSVVYTPAAEATK